jgi:hypothetical protein
MQCVRTGREDHHATKPPCHRQQREFEIAGVSVAEHGGDKALVGLTACSGDSWRDTVQNIPMML